LVLAGGVWADRLPRQRLMLGANLARFASQGLLAALLITGQARLWQLVALIAAHGTAAAFFYPAASGLVPRPYPPRSCNGPTRCCRWRTARQRSSGPRSPARWSPPPARAGRSQSTR
jgi:MFS family permease